MPDVQDVVAYHTRFRDIFLTDAWKSFVLPTVVLLVSLLIVTPCTLFLTGRDVFWRPHARRKTICSFACFALKGYEVTNNCLSLRKKVVFQFQLIVPNHNLISIDKVWGAVSWRNAEPNQLNPEELKAVLEADEPSAVVFCDESNTEIQIENPGSTEVERDVQVTCRNLHAKNHFDVILFWHRPEHTTVKVTGLSADGKVGSAYQGRSLWVKYNIPLWLSLLIIVFFYLMVVRTKYKAVEASRIVQEKAKQEIEEKEREKQRSLEGETGIDTLTKPL